MYYDDIKIVGICHRFFYTDPLSSFGVGCNSLEFIRFGHIQLQQESDGKLLDLQGPAFYWLHAGRRYRTITKNLDHTGKYKEHIFVDFLGDRSERMLAGLDELFPAGMFQPRRPKEVSRVFFRLLQLYRIGWKNNLAEIGLLLENLMYLACESTGRHDDVKDLYGLDKIAEQLRSEPFRKYDFTEMAAKLEISEDHFRRIFRQRHKLPPHAYLHHQRMLRAAELLEKDDMRIKEIVYSCNFKSFIDFSRAFKKYSGFSPRKYREEIRRKKPSA